MVRLVGDLFFFYLTCVGLYGPKHLGLHISAKIPVFMAYTPQRMYQQYAYNTGESLKPNGVTFSTRIGTTPTVPSVERDGDSFEQISDLFGVCRLEEDETFKLPQSARHRDR